MPFSGAAKSIDSIGEASFTLWQPDLFLWSTLGTLIVIGIGSAFKTAELSKGGSAVAQMLDGRLINSNATEANERKLLNVVEEMAIASGIPVPQVYLLENEAGINAFAAGHSTGDAAIGVTRGGMQMLSRDQLQGVIGHEFSHILNGDMRLNLRLMGLIFGILCLTVVGRVLLRTRGKKNPLPLLGLALIVIGLIGVFFGRLIQAAVSRQREFLADAASVQFTRNPDGLAGALKKIGGLESGSKLESRSRPGSQPSVFREWAAHRCQRFAWRRIRLWKNASAPWTRPSMENFQRLRRNVAAAAAESRVPPHPSRAAAQPPPLPPPLPVFPKPKPRAPESLELSSPRKPFSRMSAGPRRAICNTQPICGSPFRSPSNPPRAIRSARALSSTRSCSATSQPRAKSNWPTWRPQLPIRLWTRRSPSGPKLKT